MILFSLDHLDLVSNLYGITTSLGPSDGRTPAPPTSRCPRSILKEAEYDTVYFHCSPNLAERQALKLRCRFDSKNGYGSGHKLWSRTCLIPCAR
jgi:hypothetical protein